MGAFTAVTFLGASRSDRLKRVTFTALGPASYDSGGSTLDLSGATLGKDLWFNKRVDGVKMIGIAAASSKYLPVYAPAASGAPATGKIKVHDTSQAADAETSGDLSGVTFYFEATGE